MMGLEFGIWCSFSRGRIVRFSCSASWVQMIWSWRWFSTLALGLTTIPGCIARIKAVGGEALAIPTCITRPFQPSVAYWNTWGATEKTALSWMLPSFLASSEKHPFLPSVKPILFVQTIPSTIRMVSFNHFSFCFWRSHLLCHPSCRHSPCHTLPQKSPNFIISPLPFCEGSCISHPAGMFESMMILQASRFGGICDSFLQGNFCLENIQICRATALKTTIFFRYFELQSRPFEPLFLDWLQMHTCRSWDKLGGTETTSMFILEACMYLCVYVYIYIHWKYRTYMIYCILYLQVRVLCITPRFGSCKLKLFL